MLLENIFNKKLLIGLGIAVSTFGANAQDLDHLKENFYGTTLKPLEGKEILSGAREKPNIGENYFESHAKYFESENGLTYNESLWIQKERNVYLEKRILEKYTPLTEEFMEKDSLFSKLNDGLKEAIYWKNSKVFVLEKEDYKIISPPGSLAFVDGKDQEMFLQKNFKFGTLAHESGHMRDSYLEKQDSDFQKQWIEISNFNYNPFGTDSIWPNEGVLNFHGSENIHEDIGEYTGCLGYLKNPSKVIETLGDDLETDIVIGEYFNKPVINQVWIKFNFKKYREKTNIAAQELLQNNSLTEIGEKRKINLEFLSRNIGNNKEWYPLYFADPTDARYKQKIDLLKEYDFLNEKEHKTLIENVGSLHYLIE